MTQDITAKLARLGLGVSLDRLPAKVVESAKLRFLDTIAVMVAGRATLDADLAQGRKADGRQSRGLGDRASRPHLDRRWRHS